MSIFAIGDVHLSLSGEKPMDIFGGEWKDHAHRLKENWINAVKPSDTVIIAGDISWALKLKDAEIDLAWLADLPGEKVLIKGNHDLWWSAIGKLNELHDSMHFLQNTCYVAENTAICGSRGWICPGDDDFTEHDEKIFRRELLRLKMSLEQAKATGAERILAVLHYPPTNRRKDSSGVTELLREYGVEKAVYGHLHGREAFSGALQGMRGGTEYSLVSLDYLKCVPKKIYE